MEEQIKAEIAQRVIAGYVQANIELQARVELLMHKIKELQSAQGSDTVLNANTVSV